MSSEWEYDEFAENIKSDGDEDFTPWVTKETVYDDDGYVTREMEISDGVNIRETVYEWED